MTGQGLVAAGNPATVRAAAEMVYSPGTLKVHGLPMLNEDSPLGSALVTDATSEFSTAISKTMMSSRPLAVESSRSWSPATIWVPSTGE